MRGMQELKCGEYERHHLQVNVSVNRLLSVGDVHQAPPVASEHQRSSIVPFHLLAGPVGWKLAV